MDCVSMEREDSYRSGKIVISLYFSSILSPVDSYRASGESPHKTSQVSAPRIKSNTSSSQISTSHPSSSKSTTASIEECHFYPKADTETEQP